MLTRTRRNAFTLVELVAVMVVLAVLAGVAMPKYFNYADKAKTSALQGSLGGLRTGIANFFANATTVGTPAYPVMADWNTAGGVMQESLPPNPYNNLNNVRRINSLADANNRVVRNANQFGWNYYFDNAANPPVAIIWANSNTATTAKNAAGQTLTANQL